MGFRESESERERERVVVREGVTQLDAGYALIYILDNGSATKHTPATTPCTDWQVEFATALQRHIVYMDGPHVQ